MFLTTTTWGVPSSSVLLFGWRAASSGCSLLCRIAVYLLIIGGPGHGFLSCRRLSCSLTCGRPRVQATATMSDGRVFVIGGSWAGGVGGKNGEVRDPFEWNAA